jgi:hypothetical protein
MAKKNNPPKSSQNQTPENTINDEELEKALSETADVFVNRSSDYDAISADIKATEEFFKNKGIKDIFTYKFNRKRWRFHDRSNLGEEALDWRFDHVSKKFRLMVSIYNIHSKVIEGSEDPYGEFPPDFYESLASIDSSRPLLECPIETRVFYHPKLNYFVRAFADTLKEHKKNGLLYKGGIYEEEKPFQNHGIDDYMCRIPLIEKSVYDVRIFPGGISQTPLGTRRQESMSFKELENLKNKKEDELKPDLEIEIDW